jgi:three-Cys-motif partner protein
MKNQWSQRHYIDLFAGAGFARIRDTGEIVAGSPVLAANVIDEFTHLHLCEADSAKADALEARLQREKLSARWSVQRGDANEVIEKVLRAVPDRNALSITLADPYGLHLDFSTVQSVAKKQSDLIVLLADNMDALRNWAKYYYDNPNSSLDRFMGESGWRELLGRAGSAIAEKLRSRYCERLRGCGYLFSGTERVKNDQGTDLYSLVYASKHRTGLKFWDSARSVDEGGQRQLFGNH